MTNKQCMYYVHYYFKVFATPHLSCCTSHKLNLKCL